MQLPFAIFHSLLLTPTFTMGLPRFRGQARSWDQGIGSDRVKSDGGECVRTTRLSPASRIPVPLVRLCLDTAANHSG
jgi:hypothetical protein